MSVNWRLQQVALFLNLGGTALLFLSFQATSSDFRLITAETHSVLSGDFNEYALCVNNYTLLESDANRGVLLGAKGCPDWERSHSVAVVNIENPRFVTAGFICTLLGFLLQLISIQRPPTISELRMELRRLKLEESKEQ